MGRNFHVPEDPYRGLAASVVTSEVFDTRDAFDVSLSVHTSAGTTSTITYQVSNWSGRLVKDGNPPEAFWSNFTSFEPSSATLVSPVLGARYARLLRNPSFGSFVFNFNKQVR